MPVQVGALGMLVRVVDAIDAEMNKLAARREKAVEAIKQALGERRTLLGPRIGRPPAAVRGPQRRRRKGGFTGKLEGYLAEHAGQAFTGKTILVGLGIATTKSNMNAAATTLTRLTREKRIVKAKKGYVAKK